MKRNEVWLQTSWVSLYHDLITDGLHVVRKETPLRTQTKNAEREAAGFEPCPPADFFHTRMRISYTPEGVREAGSVLGAMCMGTGLDVRDADFRLPVPYQWVEKVMSLVPDIGRRPIMFYRPLVDRPGDWGGCVARNPDKDRYYELAQIARHEFGVLLVSVADLQIGREWEVGHHVDADYEFNDGRFGFPELAALMQLSTFAFSSPGFAIPLAQAVGTAAISIFGGYESSRSFHGGARPGYPPYLGIDPINPCECFRHNHKCDKRIDMVDAVPRLQAFIEEVLATGGWRK